MSQINIVPAVNTLLLLVLMALTMWRFRLADLSKLWDEIEAIKLRMSVQEKISPCPHCKQAHSIIADPAQECDC